MNHFVRAVIIVSLLTCIVFPLASGATYDISLPVSNSSETITISISGNVLQENLNVEYQNGDVIFSNPDESGEKISDEDILIINLFPFPFSHCY